MKKGTSFSNLDGLKKNDNYRCRQYLSMKASLQLGRVLGIPIRIHVSFLLVLPLFTLYFAFVSVSVLGFTLSFNDLPISDWQKLLLGLFAAILFFIAVLLHELSHSYVAIRKGYRVSGITLFIFGGVSEIESQPSEAPGEALMAFVGPAASLVIGVALLPVWYLTRGLGNLGTDIVSITAGMMSFYNLLLGVFNLIPAFPMDGGRVLRALLARRMGFGRATNVAVQVGKSIALAMGLFGLLVFNPWLILIALFIYMGAGEEQRETTISEALEGLTVGQIMTSPVSTVTTDTTVRQMVDKMMTEKHLGYPVVEGGKVVGIITLQDIQKVPSSEQGSVLVEQLMTREVISLQPDAPVMEALQAVTRNNIGRIVIMDRGQIAGIISRSDLMRVLELRMAEKGLVQR
jgi:Zn-dependent protease/CBS domain-containing protein